MEKNKISNKSFHLISFEKTDSENDNQEIVFYCDDDGKLRVYCNICDKLRLERFYKIHLKPQTHTISIRKLRQLKNWFQLNLH